MWNIFNYKLGMIVRFDDNYNLFIVLNEMKFVFLIS